MKKGNIFESIGILSLSLLLTSSLVISGAVPAMLQYFDGQSRASIEYLVSVPAVAMTVMIALSPFAAKIFNERTTIILGLCMIGIAGSFPFFLDSFPAIMLMRVLLGVGIGLINTRAVSIIGERYTGETRARLLGFRQSAETIGETMLTLAAGQLLAFSWRASFLVYVFAFVVLALYLAFVPAVSDPEIARTEKEKGKNKESENKKHKMTGKERTYSLVNAVFGGLLISTSSAYMLRIPSCIVEWNIGTAVEGNTILSVSMLAGFLSGLAYGKMKSRLKGFLLPCLLGAGAAGLMMIALTESKAVITAGAFICGFSVAGCISNVFTSLSENVSKASLNTANTFVLVGCNLGGSVTPAILKVIGTVNAELSASFYVYAAVFICIAAVICLKELARSVSH